MEKWNGFKGRAKRLDDIDLPKLGARLGVGEDHIHMFLDVETNGSGFLKNGEVKKLFERHKFHKELKGGDPAKLKRAINAGLANPRAGGYGPESAQRAKIEKAMAIDETAALRSTSWGLGQVMGFNHKAAGYPTVQAMVKAFMDDEEAQLEGSVNFILNNRLDDELRKCKPGDPESCRAFASGYNGSGYRRNNYHVKMADALLKWSRIKDTPYSANVQNVRNVQKPTQESPQRPKGLSVTRAPEKPKRSRAGKSGGISGIGAGIVAAILAVTASFTEKGQEIWAAIANSWPF